MSFLSEHQQLLCENKELLQRELKELLQRRQKELTLLRKDQKAIGTFLNMCRKVQASVKGSVLGKQFESGNSRKQFSLKTTGLCKQALF